MQLTSAQRVKIDPVLVTMSDALNAKRRGDMKTYGELAKTVPASAHTSMGIKKCGNGDLIRKLGLSTSPTDGKYGSGWLERED